MGYTEKFLLLFVGVTLMIYSILNIIVLVFSVGIEKSRT